jgi:outer membrane scaffolding protein for murein synthesis (MipA/OmpV family)
MRRGVSTGLFVVVAGGWLFAAATVHAADVNAAAGGVADAAAPDAAAAATEPTPATAPAPTAAASAPARPRPEVEGAVGPMVNYDPQYQGAAGSRLKWTPGIFIRWGRYTITNASGFVTRRDDDVMRGLAADFVRSEHTRINLALRLDRGRRSSDSAALAGLPDIRPTIRARLVGTHTFDAGIGASAGVNVDLLGRGGGTVVDLGISRSFALAPRTTWSVGLGITAASQRYMRSYFGVTPEQSLITGYPPYAPGSGLRDVSLSTGARRQFGERWVGYVGASTSCLLGPAAASPLSQRPWGWAVNGGIAWRF